MIQPCFTHDKLPSGPKAQLVISVPEVVGLNPTGSEISLSPCGLVSFLATAQKVLFEIFIQQLNLPYLNYYTWFERTDLFHEPLFVWLAL